MDISQSAAIALAAIGYIALTLLFLGVPVWNGDEYVQVGPIIKIKNFWVLFAVLLLLGLVIATATFLLLTTQLPVS